MERDNECDQRRRRGLRAEGTVKIEGRRGHRLRPEDFA